MQPKENNSSKILTQVNVRKLISLRKKQNKTVALATGTFDIVHLGHILYLKQIDKIADLLIIGVENDKTAQRTSNNSKPFNKLEYRLELLAELSCVDYVFGFEETIESYGKKSLEKFVNRYKELNPSFLAVPKWDPHLRLKKTQAKLADIKITEIDVEYEYKYW